jgi:hypothetical protein
VNHREKSISCRGFLLASIWMSQALSHLWCYDVTARVHSNIIACTAGFLFMPQDPSPASFHACGIWLILKKLDIGVGPPLSPCPGTAATAVRLGPASYEAADYHETNGWDPETMERGWPYPYRAYPILEIKFMPPTKVSVNAINVLLTFYDSLGYAIQRQRSTVPCELRYTHLSQRKPKFLCVPR